MRYYTPSRLSEHIRQTPEGYLICEAVPIARTGSMRYAPDEVPDDVTDGLPDDRKDAEVLVYRKAAEVFAPATLASFEGKPLVIDHPDEDVTPDTWADLAVGHVQNVRRGDPGRGEADDLMLADIVITRADAIEAVNDGLRELSCGYDADYTTLSPGVGEQRHIIGNHVALVPHGRAGARCRINDGGSIMATERGTKTLTDGVASGSERIAKAAGASGFIPARMETPPKRGWWDRIMGNPKVRKAVKDAEAEAAACDESEAPDEPDKKPAPATDDDTGAALEEIKLMLRTLIERLTPAESAGDEEPVSDEEGTGDEDPASDDEPTGDEDPARDEEPAPTGDKARYADANTVRRAALLAPQTRFRVGDSAVAVQRAALSIGCRDARVRRTVDAVLGGVPVRKARHATLAAAFMAASEVAAARNNRRAADALTRAQGRDQGAGLTTPADINKLNAEFYGKK